MGQRRLRVGLYGPYGCGNLGDAAIQESALHNIRLRRPEAEFLGISLDPENTRRIHGIPAFPIRWSWRPNAQVESLHGLAAEPDSAPAPAPESGLRNLLRRVSWFYSLLRLARKVLGGLRDTVPILRFGGHMWSTLRGLDCLIISGGGQISDDWGGPWDHPFALLAWVGMARLTRTRVHVLSVGAGPIRRPLSRRFFHLALRLAHSRSYRDRHAKAYLADLSCTRSDPVHPDLAFALPVDRRLVAPRAPDGRIIVGVTTMSFQGDGDNWLDGSASRSAHNEATLVEFIAGLLASGHCVDLFYTQIRSDRPAYDRILHGLAQRAWIPDGQQLRATPTRDLDHLLTQIAATDLVVSSRLHGLVLALRLHRPVIALSYQTKVDAVMGDFGLSDYCLSVDSMNTELLAERAAALLAERAPMVEAITGTAGDHEENLSRQFDRIFGLPVGGSEI